MTIDESFETASSLIAYGRRDARPVVLKVAKREGDEWRSGEVLASFGGRGVAAVYAHAGGAVLLERLMPGHALVDLVLDGRDEEATGIVAQVIGAMSPVRAARAHATVEDWGRGFHRYALSGDARIPASLVTQAHRVYVQLCETQRNRRLLHGDLQHSNVLFDRDRGWVAIDPKGVVGEIEYEIGAALRNPREDPALFTAPGTVERRLRLLASALNLDRARAVGWAFAQAVLSAIWGIEDGEAGEATDPSLVLAETMRPMLRPPAA